MTILADHTSPLVKTLRLASSVSQNRMYVLMAPANSGTATFGGLNGLETI